jgi:hypothetical protein
MIWNGMTVEHVEMVIILATFRVLAEWIDYIMN